MFIFTGLNSICMCQLVQGCSLSGLEVSAVVTAFALLINNGAVGLLFCVSGASLGRNHHLCFTSLAPAEIFTCQELPPPPPPAARLCALSPLSGRFQKTVHLTHSASLHSVAESCFCTDFFARWSFRYPLWFSMSPSQQAKTCESFQHISTFDPSPFHVFQRAWSAFERLRARFPPGYLLLDCFLHPLFHSLCSKQSCETDSLIV